MMESHSLKWGFYPEKFITAGYVYLWTNNARMILRYWALLGEDSDFPTPIQLL